MQLIKSYYNEISTPTAIATQKYLIGDISQLRHAPILGVEFYDVNDVTKNYSGATPPTTADMKKAYLVLYFEGGEYLTLPVPQLIRVRDSATTVTNHPFVEFLDNLNGQIVDWSKSYVWFGTAPATAGTTIAFNIYYKDGAK